MKPGLMPGSFVFCVVPGACIPVETIGTFRETEGLTIILPQQVAKANDFAYDGVWRQITLHVHSSLHAVGFLAAITTRLAAAGISVNAIAAFHHDHLFVPEGREVEAMEILEGFGGA